MKQAEDSRTLELPGLDSCGGGVMTAPVVFEGEGGRFFVRFDDDRASHGPFRTAEAARLYADVESRPRSMPSLASLQAQRAELQHKIEHPGRGRRPGQRVGAYPGAVKVGAFNQQTRAKTGKSQAEFAALAGISERTLRTWELGDERTGSKETRYKIVSALASCGVSYLAECQRKLQRRPVRYRCPMTGSTWSGRGLKPAWLRVALDGGAKLADFQTQ